MLVVTRYRVAAGDEPGFRADVDAAMGVLVSRAGFVDAVLGRNADEPTLWTLTLRWRDVGSYRWALSSFEVKTTAVPLLSRALDEPSAYEVLGRWEAAGAAHEEPGGSLSRS